MFNNSFEARPFRIYDAEQPNLPTKIFGGKASGIRSWDDVKYPVFLDWQKSLFGEYWVPEELQMGKDIEQYQTLTDAEKLAYQYNSGALNWLDSMASDVVTYLFMATSDPSLRTLLTIIASFETTHNVSYEHMTSTVLGAAEKERAFNEVRELPLLKKRNDFIIEKLDKMIVSLTEYFIKRRATGVVEMDDETLQALYEGLLAYQILEGEYFSGGFAYFHSLARDNKMLESNNMINLIKADENQHSEIFGLIIQILMAENPQLNTKENMEYSMNFVREAVQLEKEWSAWLYRDIDTLSIKEYHDYTEYLANLICRNAGLQEPFPENGELKAKWIVNYGSKKQTEGAIAPKADFLQGNAINYKHSDGKDDFDL
ncbi:putative ribonucleoside-diphosphate reductase beta subunit [Bacillus phage BCP78]|uniref:ribonucleoside-diphosphate reductase n=3 Tax=Tsarbombavirus BCP78 TaxID=1985182 RepID=J9PQP2_9CAUD|nr:ribonucleoside diphosphate reductase small subunit [Bacillus phage BCP78]YP_009783535.1 putative ribonucleoside-diphosphate reductase beta subunit [Bacillus phage BCU4]AEW47179.1 putative ribonucleoside-diphosphate reductase beta subunit [Bacillus phage BCP78]AEW47668.1 putative ribonucleoside-diphosphate reductase beta subunit [Bacillus phage BCU4]AQN32547.1 putative ribonucleoside-diphosphate reductase beta subunit [Bacillus phage BCP12]